VKIKNKFYQACSVAALAGAAGLFGAPAYAQDQELQTDTVQGDAAAEPEQKRIHVDEEIVVTGSRIRRNEFSSSAPISIITTDKSALAGLISAADILQGSSMASGEQINDGFSGFITDGGPGAQQISLRGLGGQRSLVLVNGKRWAPSGVRGSVTSVDLSALPNGMISRYEILKDGASSVYGADAVAGVVNAITRSSVDGASVDITYSQPEMGAGESYDVSGIWGKTGDNWNITVAAAANRQTEVVAADLDYASCPTRPRLTDGDGDNVIDNTNPQTGEDLCFGMIYGFAVSPFGWARFDPSLGPGADASNPNYDATINGVYGVPYYTAVPATGLDNSGEFYRDTLDPGVAHIQSEEDNYSFSSLGNYDFSIMDRSATAYYELYYNQRKTSSNGGFRQFFPSVPASNPSNPFGISSPLALLNGTGYSATPVVPSYNWVDPVTKVNVKRSNVFAGLKGDLSETWTYDAYFGYGWSKGTYEGQVILADQVAASLDAVNDVGGNLVCRDLANNPGCVAVDLFTQDALLNGTLPQDAVDYLTKNAKGDTEYTSFQFSGHATGELFDLPAGEVLAVIGAEYRRESIDDVPDIDAQNGNFFGSTAAGRTRGSDKVKEVFTELSIPILSQQFLAEELTVEMSGRWTDYDSYGDDTTYRLAANWQVVPWLRFRATKGTSFRAPALYEQFLGDQTGFANGNSDPCLNYASQYDPGDVIYDNCAASGLPVGFGQSGSQSIVTTTGGSGTLSAETSESYTYGFILQPEEFGLSIAVNWFDLEITNTVSSLSAASLLGICYTSVNLSSPFCSRIGARDSTDGFISGIDASFINIGSTKTSGYDIDFAFEHDFNSFDLDMDGTITYIDEYSTEILGETTDYEGDFAFPHWRADLDTRIKWREWQFAWRADFYGSSTPGPVYDPGTTNVDRVTSTKNQFFHTLSARYIEDNWEALFTIRNITDRKPPLVADGSGSVSAGRVLNTLPGAGYPLFGRTFTFRMSYDF